MIIMNKNITPPFLILLATLWMAILGGAALADVGTASGAVPGDIVEDVVLETTDRECAILDVCQGKDEVRLSDLPGRFLFIEIFNMYCPHCQKMAPDMNVLYQAIQDSPHADEMTLIGLGAGNSRYEVDFFQEQYQTPFALFPDKEMTLYGCVGSPGTPFFLIVEKVEGSLVVRFVHQGEFLNPQDFLLQAFVSVGLTP